VDQINAASTAPVPTVAPRPVGPPDRVWVPDRYVPVPGGGSVALVPGHWERRLSDREFSVPPLSTLDPADGRVRTYPGGVRPPAAERAGP
jgi:hypothetical protein